MSQASLCRFFRRAAARTLTDYVTELRVAAAAQLLIETDASTLDISFQSGFGNYSSFSRRFRCLKGVSPRDAPQLCLEHSGKNAARIKR